MAQRKPDPEIWERLLHLLELRRGENRVRGRQQVLPHKGTIRLEVEAHGKLGPKGWITLSVGPSSEDTYLITGQKRLALAEFSSVEAFLDTALQQCRRSRDYMHTNRDTAEYK
jgi:hypothetical protein